MKRILGALFLLGGALCLYLFATRAMFLGREQLGTAYNPELPLHLIGLNFPTGAFLFLGACWGFILGLCLVVTGSDQPSDGPRGGRVSRLMLLNGLLLASSIFAAYVGMKAKEDPNTIAVFAIVALAQIALGLLLLVFALFERPKGVLSLLVGAAVYLGGVGVAVATFLWGGP